MNRRTFLYGVPRLLAMVGFIFASFHMPASAAKDVSPAPIIFVHGNGDTAALWLTTIWRFESNGYPRNRLFAIDFKNPLARSNDSVAQPGRSSTQEQREELAAFIADVKQKTGAAKVILVGSSRGGYAIRNFIKNGGGVEHVSHAILCGTPNHGVAALDDALPGSEFNGNGPFLKQLNEGPTEATAGVKFLTIRSDKNDKFAQPDGRYIGMTGKPTNVTAEGPALTGALNLVLPNLDHREVAFHPLAFREMYRFLLGREPKTTKIKPESRPILNGKVSGLTGGAATNLPVMGAMVEIYRVSPTTGERIGAPAHRKTTSPDGFWGPFTADQTAFYEFVVTAPGTAITHIYRSPFPRSSSLVHLRPVILDEKDKAAGAVASLSRPRGYLGHGRDQFTLDGQIAPGIPDGVPNLSYSRLFLASADSRPVPAVVNREKITLRPWPATENHISIAEFHH